MATINGPRTWPNVNPTQNREKPSRGQALLRKRCPRCREGKIYRGLFAMNEACPVCGLDFCREPGYFTGAMYISYALAVPLLAALALVFWGLTSWPLEGILAASVAVFLLFVPWIFQYSRVVWIYLDRSFEDGSWELGDGG